MDYYCVSALILSYFPLVAGCIFQKKNCSNVKCVVTHYVKCINNEWNTVGMVYY